MAKQKIPFKIKKMKIPYLWGTRFTNDEAYKIIEEGPEGEGGEHFNFIFKRLFENEFEDIVYRNLGVDKLLQLEKHLDLLAPEPKKIWQEIYKDNLKPDYKNIKNKELEDEYEI